MTDTGKILVGKQGGTTVLKLIGEIRVTLGPTISRFLGTFGKHQPMESLVIDLRETTLIDSTGLGVLAKISLAFEKEVHRLPTLVCTNPDITRILLAMGFEHIFVLATDLEQMPNGAIELAAHQVSEQELRQQVIDAHRVLMGLNDHNEVVFRDLVTALENEASSSAPDHAASM